MERKALRVEPFSTYLERRRKAPIFPVTVAGGWRPPGRRWSAW
jgi:hypothetical protein